jgi:Group II intron, maturase-specific domain
LLPVEAVVRDVNMFLRGWVGYFKYGHSAERLSKIRHYVRMRIALFISKRHRRSRHFGMWALLNRFAHGSALLGADQVPGAGVASAARGVFIWGTHARYMPGTCEG